MTGVQTCALPIFEFPKYRMQDDREVRCYALAADAVLSKKDVAQEALKLWYAQREADDGCTWLAEHLHSGKKINGLDLWRRARIAVDANKPKAAQQAVDIEAPRLSEQVGLIFKDPARYLDKRLVAVTRNRKELAVLALTRLAASDPDQAARLLDKRWGLMLSAEEKNWTWGAIGKQAAFRLQDNASEYFARMQRELRSQYSLGYSPGEGKSGYRKLKVGVKRKGLLVQARDGYFTLQ